MTRQTNATAAVLLLATVVFAIPARASIPPSARGAATTIDLATDYANPRLALIIGDDEGDNIGSDLAGGLAAGDFNGDGFTDLLIGVYHGDSLANARPDAGEAVIIFGGPHLRGARIDLSSNGSTTVGGETRILGPREQELFGRAVAAADLDGDGFDDAIISARFGSGPKGDRFRCGDVYVIWGSNTLPGSVLDLAEPPGTHGETRIQGSKLDDQFGFSLAAADIDGDGLGDIIAGAAFADGLDNASDAAGEVHMIFGSPKLRNAVFDHASPFDVGPAIDSPHAGALFGWALATGDVDGDGIDDLLASAPAYQPGGGHARGIAHLVRGGTHLRSANLDLSTTSTLHASFLGELPEASAGYSIALGNIVSQGNGDVLIGSINGAGPDGDRTQSGTVTIIPGGASVFGRIIDLATEPGSLRVHGAAAGDALGYAIDVADLDGDGAAELLLSAIGATGAASRPLSGVAYALGASQLQAVTDLANLTPSLTLVGARENDLLGYGGVTGDFDGDGVADVAWSAWGAANPANVASPRNGVVFIHFGEGAAPSAARFP